jgi:KEOPS complex subunit Pcc1
MPNHEAVFRFSTPNAPQIYKALAPELEDEINPRSTTSCRMEGDTTLILVVTAQDAAALRAALNMVLRLITIADEMCDLV